MSDDTPVTGRVVILNGASSAGKSSIAEAFCSERAGYAELWIVIGIDDFLAKLPPAWFKGGDHAGPFSEHGFRFESSGAGLVPRAGHEGQRLMAAYRRSVAACARVGLNVIVDEVAFDEVAVDDWDVALAGLRTTWVAVRCEPDVAAARERDRGDRFEGLARGLTAVVHDRATYDFELDTTSDSIDELVSQLCHFILAG